jgi:hypothetical protein
VWAAALAGEWELLRRCPPRGRWSPGLEEAVLWSLVSDEPIPVEKGRLSKAAFDAMTSLSRSVPAGDHDTTGAALGLLVDGVIDEYCDEYDLYHPGFDLQGEPVWAGIAAVAVRRGFPVERLTAAQRVMLGPGISSDAGEPLVPATFSV